MKQKLLSIIFLSIFLLSSCATTNWDEKIEEAQFKMDAAYVEGDTKDTWNLRDNANFELQVAEGVWWVPANTLGHSRYTNKQIAAIVDENPRVKKALISNLYEAIQLYQVGDFISDTKDDKLNVRVRDPYNNYNWEKHCPGYYSVLLNRGNCSGDTNWLNYLLEDDFEEWGTFHYNRADGGGHVINYFFYEGFYYFIDMTHYRNDFEVGPRSAIETGEFYLYRKSDFISANIHKAVSPKAYVEYILKHFNESPAIFYMFSKKEVADLTSDKSKTPTHMVFDSSMKQYFTLVYIDEKKISYAFYDNNTQSLLWGDRTRHKYGTITEF